MTLLNEKHDCTRLRHTCGASDVGSSDPELENIRDLIIHEGLLHSKCGCSG